ncbi:Suppression of tumorigenicity 5 protein [Gracilariopsis chorda]|uniref:Suppression of tumorigenicity 5 protein n=1 Tax=Gracilariopsis chorda TaxID=448386 RepID=A0A2V3ISL6_9FLOR|nr:Suppression of tumorigenicity 5 protein [Gracilariopsis chorda]|eukprot:PXF45089.1 Suppression of tumorigenicity 5 protein [Gracilariopsis chorda]
MSAAFSLLRATPPPLSPMHSIPPAPPPSPPPPPLPVPPTLRSVHLVALVHLLADPTRPCSNSDAPALHFVHTHPLSARDPAQLAAASDSVLAAAAFIFPCDAAPSTHHTRPATAPPLRRHLPSTPQANPHHQQPYSAVYSQLRSAKVLPLSTSALFSALNNDVHAPPPTRPPPSRIARHSRRNPDRPSPSSAAEPSTTSTLRRRRANSLPRRPSLSPPSRTRSAGIPPFSTSHLPRVPHLDLDAPPAHPSSSLRALIPFIMSVRSHAFAVTAADGSRQYAFCRPLSSLHALVVLADSSHSALYVSALESTIHRFTALLLADSPALCSYQVHSECSHAQNSQPSFRHSPALCAPTVAAHLCEAFIHNLTQPSDPSVSAHPVQHFVTNPLIPGLHSAVLSDFATVDSPSAPVYHELARLAVPNLSSTPSTTSSGRVTLAPHTASAESSSDSNVINNNAQAPPLADTAAAAATLEFPSSSHLQRRSASYERVVSQKTAPDTDQEPRLTRENSLTHLADAHILFSHFSVRAIVILITALLEERRVCIVGPSSSLVSRAVLALENLLRPFEWPHVLSPILPSQHVHVLSAPIPFLVGILERYYPQTADLPLDDDLVFAHIQSGKVSLRPDTSDLSKHISRRLRTRLERRLTRIKNACPRSGRLRPNLSDNSLSTLMSAVSGNNDALEDDPHTHTFAFVRPFSVPPDENPVKPSSATLWRSRSQSSKLNKLGVMHSNLDMSFDSDTLAALDKAMSKFFAELLADLPAAESEQNAPNQDVHPATGTIASSILSSSSVTRKDSRTLLRTFVNTQMYMQWERDEKRDPSFGIAQNDGARRRRNRTAAIRERSLLNGRATLDDATDIEDEPAQFASNLGMRYPLLPRFKKARPASEFMDDDFDDPIAIPGLEPGVSTSVRLSNPFGNMRKLRRLKEETHEEEAVTQKPNTPLPRRARAVLASDINDAIFHDEDLGVMSGPEPRAIRKHDDVKRVRRPARSRRHRNRNQHHVNFADEIVSSAEAEPREIFSDAEITAQETGDVKDGHLRLSIASTDAVRVSNPEVPTKRPWLFLRLPGSPWTSARESLIQPSSKDGASRRSSSDKGQEENSDNNDGDECLQEQTDTGTMKETSTENPPPKPTDVKPDILFASQEYSTAPGWNLVRHWHLRRYKNFARA